MAIQGKYVIKKNKKIALNVYEMILKGKTDNIKNSGQFINILIDGYFLRRPISICDYDKKTITIIYKVVGEGTEKLTQYNNGDSLDCLVGLGNGFDIKTVTDQSEVVLVGGGVGVPPLYRLAKDLIENNIKPKIVLGFNNKKDIFYKKEFEKLGLEVMISTTDGTYGTKGFVTDILDNIEFDYYYTCGPQPMLLSIHKKYSQPGQLSFEERMGCGFGACMGCSCKTLTGYKRICKEGPVLMSSEVLINE